MAFFAKADYNKHDYKYVKALIADIKEKKKIKTKKGMITISHTDALVLKIEKDLKRNKCDYNDLMNLGWTSIDKAPYSKIGSKRSVPVTDESEQGVIIWLDILLELTKVPTKFESSFSGYLSTYKPNRAKFKNGNDVKKTIKFLLSKDDWNNACFYSALSIYNQFGSGTLKNYEFHQNTTQFDSIRSGAQKLYKKVGITLSVDKWNPSDIWLFKKGANFGKLFNTKTIQQYNQIISEHKDFIGISLKKGTTEANQGKAAINNVVKMKSHIQNVQAVSGWVEGGRYTKKGRDKMIGLSKTMKQLLGGMLYVRDTAENEIANAIITSNNFQKSTPVILSWLSHHKNKDDIIDSMELLVQIAASKFPISCSHWKSYGTSNKIVHVDNTVHIEIQRFRMKLNGDTDFIVDVKIDGTAFKGQIRSFGSMPQLELKKQDSMSGWKKI